MGKSFKNKIQSIAAIAKENSDDNMSSLRKKIDKIADISRDNNGRMTPTEVGRAYAELQKRHLSKKGGLRKTNKKSKRTKKTRKWFAFFTPFLI